RDPMSAPDRRPPLPLAAMASPMAANVSSSAQRIIPHLSAAEESLVPYVIERCASDALNDSMAEPPKDVYHYITLVLRVSRTTANEVKLESVESGHGVPDLSGFSMHTDLRRPGPFGIVLTFHHTNLETEQYTDLLVWLLQGSVNSL